MSIDIARVRRDTPACQSIIHFNNAGAALMPQPVVQAVIEHLERETRIGAYEAYTDQLDAIEHTYDAVAALLNCHPDEVAIIENATRAWDMAFYAIPFKAGDRILTSVAEYASNYIAYLQVARKTGAVVEVIPNDDYGQTSVEDLRAMMDEQVKLISITHVPTNGGLVNPAAEIGKVAREAKVYYLLDACQSAGQLDLNVEEIGCDMLSATGRKYLRGPRGTGFLYVRRQLIEQLEPPLLDLHAAEWTSLNEFKIRDDARRFENWECNFAGKIGLGVAIDYARELGIAAIAKRVNLLAETLRQGLRAIPGVMVTDLGERRSGIVTFTVEGKDPKELREQLRAEHQINVWSSPAEYTLIDMQQRELASVIRASVHYYNTETEIEKFCEVLKA
ncbi:MAG: aminotransferase class V-fold PLP-dependent enzyme [Acidobacteriota bacterium]